MLLLTCLLLLAAAVHHRTVHLPSPNMLFLPVRYTANARYLSRTNASCLIPPLASRSVWCCVFLPTSWAVTGMRQVAGGKQRTTVKHPFYY